MGCESDPNQVKLFTTPHVLWNLVLLLLQRVQFHVSDVSPAACQGRSYDVVLLLDSSSSIGSGNWQLVRQFAADLAASLDGGIRYEFLLNKRAPSSHRIRRFWRWCAKSMDDDALISATCN